MSDDTADRRGAGWPDGEPRQRRAAPWPEDQERQRRRGRWSEFREGYPRIVTGTAIGLVLLLLIDVALAVAAWRFSQQKAAAHRSMTGLERERAGALVQAREDRMALMMALVAQQAIQDRGLNLSVSVEAGTMDLQREGAQLRRMKVALGPEASVGPQSDGVRLVPPRGKRQLVRLVDESFVWSVPRWVFAHRSLPLPGDAARAVPGGLGRLALILDDGTLIYSLPEAGPLSDRAYVMPGTVRAELADLEAIRENLTPGLPVYFH
jgi:hypothetical protein